MPRLLAFLLLAFAASLTGADRLFEGGRWVAPIILPKNPEPDEWYGAQTLADWCERVTGRRPEVIQEGVGAIPTAGMYIGHTTKLLEAGIDVPKAEGDIAVRRTIRGAVFLIGNSPLATRIAIGRFCEQHLGVFFAMPGEKGADWMILNSIGLPADDTFRPSFHWREVGGLNEISMDWANSIGLGRVPAFSHGLHEAFGKKEWQENQELFPKIGGVRIQPLNGAYEPNPNLAHPQAPEMGARYARGYFHMHPGAFSVPMGVNDTLSFDDSVRSEGWYRARPVRTNYLIGFLNNVSDSFWEPSGDVQGNRHAIGTLAYLQTLRAPTVRVHPAIFPWVCADRIGYADAAFAAQERTNLAAWTKSGARRVGLYDYWHGAEYAVPKVHFSALAASIGAAHSAGVVGWYSEGSPLWAYDAPKFWLAAKLLEDPTLDPEVLLRQWFAAAYGPGAPAMREAFRAIESAWQRDARLGGPDQFLRHFNDERGAMVLNDTEVALVSARLAAARASLAQQDKVTHRQRAQLWRLGQFDDTWAMTCAFRSAVQARQVNPQGSPAALSALQQLTEAEISSVRTEDAFNRQWGAYGTRVRWTSFVQRNPRPTWVRLVQPKGDQEAELTAWAKADGLPGQLAYRAATSNGAPSIVLLFDGATVPAKALFLSPSRANQVNGGAHGLHAVAPAGKLGPFPVTGLFGSSQIMVIRLRLSPVADQESEVRLTLTFKSGGKLVVASVLGGRREAVLVAQVPLGTTGADYEIAFKREIFIEEASVSVLTDAQLPTPR